MNRSIALKLVLQNTAQNIFWAEMTLMLALFGAYMYFISASIVNVVLRQEATVEIANINSNISSLEAEYLTKKQKVDAHMASTEGFAPITATHYITGDGGKVSSNN